MFDWNPRSGQPAEHTGIVEKVFRRNGRQYPDSSASIAGFGHLK